MSRQIHVDPPARKADPTGPLTDVKWLTAAEASAKMRTYSPVVIRQLARAGELEYLKRSEKAKMWISERSIEAFLKRVHRPAKAVTS